MTNKDYSSELDNLAEALYSTGFVDGQNYAENETKDEAFVAKAKAKLSALLRRVEVELLKDLITQHSEVHIVRKTIVHGSDTVPKGSQLGMVPTVYINAIISELGAEL